MICILITSFPQDGHVSIVTIPPLFWCVLVDVACTFRNRAYYQSGSEFIKQLATCITSKFSHVILLY